MPPWAAVQPPLYPPYLPPPSPAHPKAWEPLNGRWVTLLYVLSAIGFFLAPVWAILWALDEHPGRKRHGRIALSLYVLLMGAQCIGWGVASAIVGGGA